MKFMAKEDKNNDCGCGEHNEVKLCDKCGGIGRVSKKTVFLKLGNRPKETEQCPNCKGTGSTTKF
ncbi:MAG: hypothetical protein P1P85_05450 [Patescibacteria group bacterium]|nr:hypothetical protein [Patescibacteria group bacterium]